MSKTTLTHKERAQERADRRLAFQAHRETGIPVNEALAIIAKQRVATKPGPAPRFQHPDVEVPGLDQMHPLVAHKLASLNGFALRDAGGRALEAVVVRYGMRRIFVPHNDTSFGDWKQMVENALVYRRRGCMGLDTKPIDELIDIELALIFVRRCSGWSASKVLHTPRQYGVFLEELAQQREQV